MRFSCLFLIALLCWASSHADEKRIGVDAQKTANNAVKKKAETDNDPGKVEQFFIVQPAPEAGPKDEDAQQRRKDEASEFWTVFGRRIKVTETWLVVFTFLLFVVTLALAIYTAKLWGSGEMNLKRQLRPYVGAIGQLAKPATLPGEEEIKGWLVAIQIGNRGQSPAIRVEIRLNHQIGPEALPDDFDFADVKVKKPSAISLLPKDVIETASVAIRVEVFDAIIRNEGFVYLWGWIEYDDTFEGTLRHRTEFCKVIEVRGDYRMPGDPFFFRNYPSYNAMDGDCRYKPGQTPTEKPSAQGDLPLVAVTDNAPTTEGAGVPTIHVG